jgi:hypothetical protein
MYRNPVKQAVPHGFSTYMLTRRSNVMTYALASYAGSFSSTIFPIYSDKAISISGSDLHAKMERYQVCYYSYRMVMSKERDKNLRTGIEEKAEANKNRRSNTSVISINISSLRQELFCADVEWVIINRKN